MAHLGRRGAVHQAACRRFAAVTAPSFLGDSRFDIEPAYIASRPQLSGMASDGSTTGTATGTDPERTPEGELAAYLSPTVEYLLVFGIAVSLAVVSVAFLVP